jgi:hypothetical protein
MTYRGACHGLLLTFADPQAYPISRGQERALPQEAGWLAGVRPKPRQNRLALARAAG